MNRQKLNRLNKLAEKIGNGNQEETNQAFEEMMGIYKNEFRHHKRNTVNCISDKKMLYLMHQILP